VSIELTLSLHTSADGSWSFADSGVPKLELGNEENEETYDASPTPCGPALKSTVSGSGCFIDFAYVWEHLARASF
jgi:hypothetical protein